MKTLLPRPCLFAVILILGSVSSICHGAETTPAAGMPVSSSGTVQVSPPAEPNIDIDFPGGSIAQLVTLLAKSGINSFNLIGEKPDMEVQLPPFSLRNVEPGALGAALQVLLRHSGVNLMLQGTSKAILGVLSREQNPAARSTGSRSAFESFQLTPYLADQTVDDIVGAIRAGWELDPAHDGTALRLRFHPATSVLLVSGPDDAIVLARNVLMQLKRTPEKRHPINPIGTPPPETEKK